MSKLLRDISIPCKGMKISISLLGFVRLDAPLEFHLQEDEQDYPYLHIKNRILAKNDFDYDVFSITAHNVDKIVKVNKVAEGHETKIIDGPFYCAGGSGANTAAILAACGLKVGVSGVIGNDLLGKFLKNSLEDVGVNVDLLAESEGRTGRADIIVPKGGERFIAVYESLNDSFADAVDVEQLIRAASRSRLLHLSSFSCREELDRQIEIAKSVSQNTVISLTPGALYSSGGADDLAPLLTHVSILFLYKEQLHDLIKDCSPQKPKSLSIKDMLESYFAWKVWKKILIPQIIFVKDTIKAEEGHLRDRILSVGSGVKEVTFFKSSDSSNDPGFEALDTTGAGDAAAAGAIKSFFQGQGLGACAEEASGFAGYFATKYGGRGALADTLSPSLSPLSDYRSSDTPPPSELLP